MPLGAMVILYIIARIFSSKPMRGNYEYKSCGTILTPAGQAFFKALKEAVGETVGISLKPRLANFVGREWLSLRDLPAVFMPGNALHGRLEGIVPQPFQPYKRKPLDAFVNQALQSADILLHRSPTR